MIKVGDKVRVREGVICGSSNGYFFSSEMMECKGREFIVLRKDRDVIKLDGLSRYAFVEEWLEKVDGGFELDDWVVIKDFDEMSAKYGMSSGYDSYIRTRFNFTKSMMRFCGKKATIMRIENDGGVTLLFDEVKLQNDSRRYSFSLDMIKPCTDERPVMEEDPTSFDFDKATQAAMKLFSDYKYLGANESVIRGIIKKAYDAKRNLRAIYRKHPKWNEDQQAIIFSEEFETGINKDDLSKSMGWFLTQLYERFKRDRRVDFDKKRYEELDLKIKFGRRYADDASCCEPYVMEAIKKQHDDLMDEYVQLIRKRDSITWNSTVCCYLTIDDARELETLRQFCYRIMDAETNIIVDDDVMRYINELNKYWKTNGKTGQKLSRFMMKVFKHYGIDDIKIMKGVTHNGTEEMKDYGFNYYFAMFGDAINPLHIKKYTVISVNPLDYWTMSFGKNWSSCHTIDKLNVRKANSSHYHGSSSSGTESYMLDDCTSLFYTVDNDYVGEMWKANKDRRMNFHVAKDGRFMIFGRLYPDGRDGGETGLAAQFRNTMQKVLAECIGENNLWKVEKGTVGDYAYTVGTNYADYHNYSDTGMCYISGGEKQPLLIGRYPICPNCGERHGNLESVFCGKHHKMDVKKCAHCGDIIDDEADAIFCEDNGCWYCGGDCAFEHGVHYCEDDERWHTDDQCCSDSHDGLFYHDSSLMISVGGQYFYRTVRNMEADGWVRRPDGGFTSIWRRPQMSF